MGRIIEFNGKSELNKWEGNSCNQIVGTDSTIFPPFLAKEDGIWSFEPAICRSMGAVYEKQSKYANLPTSRYVLDLGDISVIKSMKCYLKKS